MSSLNSIGWVRRLFYVGRELSGGGRAGRGRAAGVLEDRSAGTSLLARMPPSPTRVASTAVAAVLFALPS